MFFHVINSLEERLERRRYFELFMRKFVVIFKFKFVVFLLLEAQHHKINNFSCKSYLKQTS